MKEHIMLQALRLAQLNEGLTGSNPSVGCIIVKNGDVISTGTTGINGTPHAEKYAIDKAGDVRNCELYTTLEPCSHFGKNPPCTDAIIQSGIKTVYFGCTDPDARVSGNGIRKLHDAGIKVTELNNPEINRFYKPYFHTRKTQSAFITAKIAGSADGRIATDTGESKWITSPEMRGYTNFMRHKFNGIAIGGNTFKADAPSLACRTKGLEEFSPKRFVISNSLQNVDGFTILRGTPQQIAEELFKTHAVQHVLLEGGNNVISSFLKAGVVSRLIIAYSQMLLGGSKTGTQDLSIQHITNAIHLTHFSTRHIGGDIITEWDVNR